MKKLNKIFLILILLMLPFIMYPQSDREHTVFFDVVPKESRDNVAVHKTAEGAFSYTVADRSYQNKDGRGITDLVLSFNKSARNTWKDDTAKYNIHYANYTFQEKSGSLGKGAALFYKQNHRVEIETSENLWLGSCSDLGSFTIEFRFNPYKLIDDYELFSRIGYFSGNKRGIRVSFKEKRIVAAFYDFFVDNDGTRYSVFLNRGKRLVSKKWYHFSISYDRVSGKLSKYINGEEVEVMYITRNKKAYAGVFVPSFGGRNKDGEFQCIDSASAVIAARYRGLIDEFRISYQHYEELLKNNASAFVQYKGVNMPQRSPVNNSSIITSPVYSFDSTGTRVTLFQWDELLRQDTFVWMQFRIADERFARTDFSLQWHRIKNNQKGIFLKKMKTGQFLRGKYYQWRAYLVPSPDGKHSPSLSNVRLQYHTDTAPNSPRFLEVVKSTNNALQVRWKKNVESDILGYKIYYGIRTGQYDGVIHVMNGKPLTNKTSNTNYITINLTNELIEENKGYDTRSLLAYPRLKNTILYYIAVSAYDTYKPGTVYNHESPLSPAVTGRPYGGSEID